MIILDYDNIAKLTDDEITEYHSRIIAMMTGIAATSAELTEQMDMVCEIGRDRGMDLMCMKPMAGSTHIVS